MSTTNEKKTPVFLIVDDHPAIRMILKQIILKINAAIQIDEAMNIDEMIRLVKTKKYDLAILDINLEDGVTHVELPVLKLHQPDMKILFFSTCPEDIYAQRMIQLGADGFINKKASEAEIHDAINKVMSGRRYLSPDFLYALLLNPETGRKVDANPFLQLSTREFEVLTLILYGKSNKEICSLINLSASTVSTHKIRILEKLNVTNDIELSQMASKYGISSL